METDLNRSGIEIMKQISVILTLLLSTLLCFGQKEHLEPAKVFNPNDSARYGGYYSVAKAHNDQVYKLLYSGFSQNPYARYTSMPSFDGGYAFSVEKIKKKNYILSNRLSENYWYALIGGREGFVKIDKKKIKINNELYLKIGELFGLLTEQTKEKERIFETLPDGIVVELITVVSDGTVYTFSTTDIYENITKTGTIHSPHPNDKPMLNRLVKICDDLCSLEIKRNISQKNIMKDIDELINYLKD